MRALFPDQPDVVAETQRVANLCEFDFAKRYFLPQYPRPAEFASDNDLLVHLARACHRGGLAVADVGHQGPADMRPDSRRGLRGDLWRVARLLTRRGQGDAAREGDLRTAILAAREEVPIGVTRGPAVCA